MKRLAAGILAAGLVFVLSACFGSNTVEKEETPYPVAVGNVTITEKPERVATLSAQLTNILEDLGYGDRIIAVASEEAEKAGSARKGIGTALVPDLQAIKEASPNLLFTSAPMAKSQLDELSEAGVQVVVLSPVDSLDALYARYYDVITAMDGKVEAGSAGKALIDAMKADVERIADKVPEEKKSFLFICTIDPYLATPDTVEGALLALIGTNAAEGESYTVSAETLSSADPDVLFYAAPLQAENIRQNANFAQKRAVAEGALYEADRSALLDGTGNMIGQLRQLAALMYPDVDFSDTAVEVSDASGGSAG